MQAARMVLAVAGLAVLTLAACGRGDKVPELMNVRSSTQGPDEFAILPPKALSLPENLTELPEPTPGGGNLTDPKPLDDAILALGGRPGAGAGGDAALVGHTSRYGVASGIRQSLAAEDLEFRRRNNGRLLERLFNVNVYYKAYDKQSLDQYSELARWRRAGVRTPSAPPDPAAQ